MREVAAPPGRAAGGARAERGEHLLRGGLRGEPRTQGAGKPAVHRTYVPGQPGERALPGCLPAWEHPPWEALPAPLGAIC